MDGGDDNEVQALMTSYLGFLVFLLPTARAMVFCIGRFKSDEIIVSSPLAMRLIGTKRALPFNPRRVKSNRRHYKVFRHKFEGGRAYGDVRMNAPTRHGRGDRVRPWKGRK